MKLPFLFIFSTTVLISCSVNEQDEPQANPDELIRITATEPADALDTFEIRPGFKLELAAHEPLVVDPIDIEFDENGRLFAVEMRGYSEHREDALGRIKLLVDDDDDGIFDRATVYAENLKWPTSVCCYDGGIFVAASPDIFYFKDTDGDGVSDIKETVFTGFGATASRLNMQALVNSLTWGPDNRIWGATARNGGLVRRPDQSETEAVNLQGADFSFDPKTRDIRAENGTAQFGMSFDSHGRRFVSSNSDHIQWVAWERESAKDNPYYNLPKPLVSIATAGGAAPVYRISPDEPWRIVRTRWRISGVVQGMVEGGGRVSGYFTSATGITLYTGNAFDPSFHDNAFIGDAGSNLVHRKTVRNETGKSQPIAERSSDESQIEFLRSRDNWFRPVNFANGPDGCLYICDMYREVIEHPWSLPLGIKKHVDLDSGNNRGRIWRVVPTNFERPEFSLKHDSGWQQVTNRRLAYESGSPKTRASPARNYDLSDPWTASLKLNSLTSPEEMVSSLKTNYTEHSFRAQLANMIGKTGNGLAINQVIDAIAVSSISENSEDLLIALGEGLQSAKIEINQIDSNNSLNPFFAKAIKTAVDPKAQETARTNAIKLLALDNSNDSTNAIRHIISDTNSPDSIRSLAIDVLQPSDGKELIKNWPGFSPNLKLTAIAALSSHSPNAYALLQAIQSGIIPQSDIPLSTAATLRNHSDSKVKALAAKALPVHETISRQAIVERYQSALKLAGDKQRGKAVFTNSACFTCHQTPEGDGFAVGPDLATFKNAGSESIIKNLFDPNAEVAPQYQAFAFTLINGESLSGIIAYEDTKDVTIRMVGGADKTVSRKEVAGMKSLGQSLMPEGMESILTNQDVADLLSYISTAE